MKPAHLMINEIGARETRARNRQLAAWTFVCLIAGAFLHWLVRVT